MTATTRPAPPTAGTRARFPVRGALAWSIAVPFIGWAVVRGLGVERGYPAVPLVAFTPYVAAIAPAAVVAGLWTRRPAAAGVGVLAALTLIGCVLPRAVPDGGRPPYGPRLAVLSANLLAGSGDAAAVVDLVRRYGVDVLALQEFTPWAAQALGAAGIDELLPYRVAYPHAGIVGSALYSRHPLRDDGLRVHGSGFTQARATVTVPGAAPVAVESVHAAAPASRALMSSWEADLAAQPPATADGPVRILAGDFNATLDHAALRRLIRTGYRDAAAVAGAGLRATWPVGERWYLPGVALDRVLADRRVGVRSVGVHRIPGSDHRAFRAELILPPAAH